MHVQNVSRQNYITGQFFPVGDNAALVQITTDRPFMEPPVPFKKVIQLQFPDFDDPECITQEEATKLFDFLEDANEQGMNILIHCDAGVSRSAAVALFCLDCYGYEDIYPTFRRPNMYVYRALVNQVALKEY